MVQDQGEGNNGDAEADGRRRGGVQEKNILWTPTLNMRQLIQWVTDNDLSWWDQILI